MPQFRLTILEPSLAREFDVPLGVTIIGREPATNLPILNPQVSRRHAQLLNDGMICELVDLGSANGTFVNDTRMTPQAPVSIEDGMRLRFGPVEVSVQVIPDAPVVEEPAVVDEAEPAPEPPGDETSVPVEPPPVEEAELVLDLPDEVSTPDRAVLEPPLPESDLPAGARRDGLLPENEAIAADESHGAPTHETDTNLIPADPLGQPTFSSGRDGAPPPDRPSSSTPWLDDDGLPDNPFGLPGLSIYSRSLIHQLPGIYQTDFMARFLGIFESIQTPIEWNVDNFDLFLDPDSSPAAFLSWLAGWYGLTFDASWREDQRRTLIGEAHAIFTRRGTRWALARILQIYTGCDPQITDTGEGIEPFTFRVRLALPDTTANRTLLTRLIDAHKPAFTTYRLELTP